MQFTIDDTFDKVAKMKVIGVGGAGGNAVNRMVESGLEGVEFIAVNTDAMALDNNLANIRLQIGDKVTGGLGAGANPKVGMEAMEESREAVKAQLEGCDMVFVTAGMGGGTGTGAAPIVADVARELGILSVGVVTKPFQFEGPVRARNAKAGLDALRKIVDTIIVIPNQKLLSVIEKKTTFREAFKYADEVLTSATRGISDIILKHGDIQVDFADVKAIMQNGGDALMGTGVATGENRAEEAAEKAIHSPLLDDVSITGATGVLVNITAGEDLGMLEVDQAMNYIYEAVGTESDTNIIFGTVINPDFEGEMAITVVATGFAKESESVSAPAVQEISNVPQEVAQPAEAVATEAVPSSVNEVSQVEAAQAVSHVTHVAAMEPAGAVQGEERDSVVRITSPLAPERNYPKTTSFAGLEEKGAGEGESESSSDIDYETPAFLRYSSDS